MKYLFSLILVMFMTTAIASKPPEYKLDIVPIPNTDDELIVHNPQDWEFVDKSADYKVYVEKGMLGYKNEMFEFHAVTEYDVPAPMSFTDIPIKRIYSYGVLNCKEANLYLLIDLYVDVHNKIIMRQYHEFGSYVSNMNNPNTIRYNVYNLLCKESV